MSAPDTSLSPDPRPQIEEGPSGAQVSGSLCGACGYAVALERPRCPVCHADRLEPRRFGPGGTVWSSTVVRIPVAGRTPPYTLAYVNLDENGPRILAHVIGSDAAPAVGARVRLTGVGADGDAEVEAA
ncbi:unannotated protein [freshwater metagenome]|uniref:Unannotated protein n=1 Tax=freshwater metagenome TaxID=449393 RepID=A0A6J7DST0_9ZZZZ|nr:hypothetical protein [Actinomycetota bacterium]